MRIAGDVVIMVGVLLVLLASIGLIRLRTTEARLHAAGKASPVAFLVTALGALAYAGPSGVALLLVAVAVMAITLPLGMHLLFRALYRARR